MVDALTHKDPAAFVPATGAHLGSWTIQGTAIQDIQVDNSMVLPVAPARQPPVHQQQQQQRQQLPQPQPPPAQQSPQTAPQHPPPPARFVDPAILSYEKTPVPPAKEKVVPPVEAPSTPVKSMLAKAAESLPTNGSPFIGDVAVKKGKRDGTDSPAAVRTRVPGPLPTPQDGAQETGEGRKKVRRGQKKKNGTVTPAADPPPVMNVEVSRNGNDMSGESKRGKGWRQTPLLQPTASAIPSARGKRQTRRQREEAKEARNGWATEDATDVQDLGDFDFEASNSLFDKKGVFEELRQGDTTADEERLVSHNRLLAARPGTHGGRNLHPTESVLSPKVGATKYGSHNGKDGADSSSDADTELNFAPANANGRSSSRHSATRVKKMPSRQNSNQAPSTTHPLAGSASSERGSVARSLTGLPTRSRPQAAHMATSPLPERVNSPHARPDASVAAKTEGKARFEIESTRAMCPVLHPTALDTLEAETVSRFGLTREAMAEIAARGIAETAWGMFDRGSIATPAGGASRRGSRVRGAGAGSTAHPDQQPVIVVLAGNHPTGARTVAAARHMASRGCRIIVAEALYDGKESQDPEMRTHISILRRLQRAGQPMKRGGWKKAQDSIKNLPAPPALIIDALLAGQTYQELQEDPNVQVASEAKEMIDWANRSRAPVLSVSCPSGVSGVDGTSTVVEGEPLAIRPEMVVSLGVPVAGLLEAMRAGERWECKVVDTGVNITLRSEDGVGFGGAWVVGVEFVQSAGEGEAVGSGI